MPRIKGVDIPNEKRIEVSLSYIYENQIKTNNIPQRS